MTHIIKPEQPCEKILLLAAESGEHLLHKLEIAENDNKIQNYNVHGIKYTDKFRLGILNPNAERIEKAKEIIRIGKPVRGNRGVWYESDGLLKNNGKIVFMFPGIDSISRIDISDVAHYFGETLESIEAQDNQFLENRGKDVFYTSELIRRILSKMHVTPDAIIGHSLGEWIGMVASGIAPQQNVAKVIGELKPGMLEVPGVVFGALGCSVEKAKKAIECLPQIEISHDNCPSQTIVCGIESSINHAFHTLINQNVICQRLDFKSGFHTTLFKPYLKPIEQLFESLSFSKPTIPFWSATTCRPYPHETSAIYELITRHLVEPVRFRELTEALYDEGFRVFIQVGPGSLSNFIGSTLRGRPHQALSTILPTRSGLQQLQRFYLDLFAEGAHFNFDFFLDSSHERLHPYDNVTPNDTPRDATHSQNLIVEFRGLLDDIQKSTFDIMQALSSEGTNLKPFEKLIKKVIALKNFPELLDHCLYKQNKNWTNIKDRYPIFPITGTIEWISQIALEHFPHFKVISVENIVASKWIAICDESEIDIKLKFEGMVQNKVSLHCELVDYFSATIILAKQYTSTSNVKSDCHPLIEPQKYPILSENIYKDGWLFHGPSFQCIAKIGDFDKNGLDGSIQVSTVRGSLLDNAGQLAGLWAMQSLDHDKYVMPIRIKNISYFSDPPQMGEVECKVRVDRIRVRDIMFHFELTYQNKLWAKIEGWEKWRHECDDKFWNFLLNPGRNLLADIRNSSAWYEPAHLSKSMIDNLFHRYLREEERAAYQNMSKRKSSWICGRVAVKDAIRNYLWSHGYKDEIFPAEIWIENDIHGRPFIKELPGNDKLFISISHKENLGVGCVSPALEIGVDIEEILPREKSFETLTMSQSETDLMPSELRSEWITRFWGAKEAYSKSKGMGLQGNAKKFQIHEFQKTDAPSILKIRVQDKWIKSTKRGSYILSETET